MLQDSRTLTAILQMKQIERMLSQRSGDCMSCRPLLGKRKGFLFFLFDTLMNKLKFTEARKESPESGASERLDDG